MPNLPRRNHSPALKGRERSLPSAVNRPSPKKEAPAGDLSELHAKVGQLALENDFLSGALRSER